MKKTLAAALILLSLVYFNLTAQTPGRVNEGLGIGIDFGGFGAQVAYQPGKIFSVFGALGYNLAGAGYNLGLKASFPTKKRVEFYLSGMYGYNAVLIIKDNSSGDKIYYGPSFGAGIAIKSRNMGMSFLSLGLIFPIRSGDFQDDIDALKYSGYDVSEPLPIGISVGYHSSF
jgi:hypothetical protein